MTAFRGTRGRGGRSLSRAPPRRSPSPGGAAAHCNGDGAIWRRPLRWRPGGAARPPHGAGVQRHRETADFSKKIIFWQHRAVLGSPVCPQGVSRGRRGEPPAFSTLRDAQQRGGTARYVGSQSSVLRQPTSSRMLVTFGFTQTPDSWVEKRLLPPPSEEPPLAHPRSRHAPVTCCAALNSCPKKAVEWPHRFLGDEFFKQMTSGTNSPVKHLRTVCARDENVQRRVL